jgi:hypothetical protein
VRPLLSLAPYMYAIVSRNGRPPPVLGLEARVPARLRTDAALVLGRGASWSTSGSEYGRAGRIVRLCEAWVFFVPRLLISEDGAVSLLVPAKERYQV